MVCAANTIVALGEPSALVGRGPWRHPLESGGVISRGLPRRNRRFRAPRLAAGAYPARRRSWSSDGLSVGRGAPLS